ncbi:MAG: nicotinamide riboside transporter PnuC [Enterobacterales bacterium]|nr:nicotinamide riboside transporter PnuC [Enterobacterales bacterium]
MNTFFENFIAQLFATSYLEWMAVVLAVVYLILAIKENSWCWVSAFFSTAIYVYLFFDINLFMESFLNFYYLIMAVYGWQQWQQGKPQEQTTSSAKRIITWQCKYHFYAMLCCSFLIVVSYWLLSHYTQQAYPLLDSTTTWLAIFTTYLVTQKVLENWLYWVVIDLLSIYLYLEKGMALTALLFVGYVALSIVGFFSWKRHFSLLSNSTVKTEFTELKN